jgi:uracil-DNA glycosylase family 4
MADERDHLTQAARQLLAIEELLGGPFLPARRRPLPEPVGTDEPAPARAASAADAAAARSQKADALRRIDQQEVSPCTRCALAAGRHNTVFGEGDPDAELMFIGEAPGHDEDMSGRPFVGRAGELLTRMIQAMGLTRDDVFIGNILKCRPPGNRAPQPDEVDACWDYLVRQIQIIQPTVIVALGNPAAHALLDTRVGITKLRGQWQLLPPIGEGLAGLRVMPTFHPAYVLRQYTRDNRQKVWSDLQKVMEILRLAPPAPA